MASDTDDSDLRTRLALVQERLDRYTLRLTAGYGSDSDRAHWLQWLHQLRAERDQLTHALAAADGRPDAGGTSRSSGPGDPA